MSGPSKRDEGRGAQQEKPKRRTREGPPFWVFFPSGPPALLRGKIHLPLTATEIFPVKRKLPQQPRKTDLFQPEAHRHPHPPALRASPYPEVTGRSCRLPSPARDRSSRGGAPREPDAVVGTVRTGGDVLPLRVFMDRRRKPDTPRGGVSCRPAPSSIPG
jgi:hypothetical protein